MPKLSKLYSKPKKIVIPFEDDDSLEMMVATHKITPALMKDMADKENSGESLQALVDYLCSILVSWNATDDKGKVLPIDREILSSQGIEVLNKLVSAVNEGILSPNEDSSPE